VLGVRRSWGRSGGATLIPFAITETDSRRHLNRFIAETFEQGLENGRRELAASSPDRAALAWDGFVTLDTGRTDAIFIEAQDRAHGATSYVFAGRYQPGKRLFRKKPKPLDDAPILVEQRANLISG
jgi:hypothetical protein